MAREPRALGQRDPEPSAGGGGSAVMAAPFIVLTDDQFQRLLETIRGGGGGAPLAEAPPATQVNTWEDDPFSQATPTPNPPVAATVAVRVPAFPAPLLRVSFADPEPPPARYAPGTPEFRFWLAAEALGRAIGFWAPLLPVGTRWSSAGSELRVTLVAGDDLNAFYSRVGGLKFFRHVTRGTPVFSGASPDVVCHELGHAILDAVRPQLFDAASIEAAAFHEAFGDMSSILSALQLPSVRNRVIQETGGRLSANSRISRLAEQLGWAIRQQAPSAVDADCLRNAANRFFYRAPATLPPDAPSRLLSSEPHSFSRVFTGAFLEALARMVAVLGSTNDATLARASRDVGQLLIDGVRTAPVTPAYYSQVAAAMIQADRARNGGRYRAALGFAFVRRGILSPAAVAALAQAPLPRRQAAPLPEVDVDEAGVAGVLHVGERELLAYDDAEGDDGHLHGYESVPGLPLREAGVDLDLGMPLLVHAPAEEERFAVASAASDVGSAEVPSAAYAAQCFVEDLLRQGRIDFGDAVDVPPELAAETRVKSHVLVPSDGARLLRRVHFDCGFRLPDVP